MEKFNIETATKAECLTKANRMLELGLKAEAEGKSMSEGLGKNTKMRQVEFALNHAAKVENAAFDGRQ